MPTRGSYRIYRTAGVVVKPLMRWWFRMRVEGAGNVPGSGPVILAANHRSNMDPVLLAAAVRRPVTFMAKAELFVGPLRWLLQAIEQFPVRRGGIDREALRECAAVLGRGSVLGLFPEGTRGDGRFSSIHPGIAYLVVRQRCPIVPVAIFGTERVRRRFGWLPWASPVRIVLGEPFELPGAGDGAAGRAGRRAATERLHHLLRAFLERAERAPRSDADILTKR
jgi:1-acyl-sn-glycerol-3-phosphate acyltransferase